MSELVTTHTSPAFVAGAPPPQITKAEAVKNHPDLANLALQIQVLDLCCQSGCEDWRKLPQVCTSHSACEPSDFAHHSTSTSQFAEMPDIANVDPLYVLTCLRTEFGIVYRSYKAAEFRLYRQDEAKRRSALTYADVQRFKDTQAAGSAMPEMLVARWKQDGKLALALGSDAIRRALSDKIMPNTRTSVTALPSTRTKKRNKVTSRIASETRSRRRRQMRRKKWKTSG